MASMKRIQFKITLCIDSEHPLCVFQRQLVYQLKDGSFSAFGEDPDNSPGSVWITAQTMSAFRRCQKFVDVDEAVIGRALGWLQSKQAADGSFKEPKGSKIINKVMQVRFTTQLHILDTFFIFGKLSALTSLII